MKKERKSDWFALVWQTYSLPNHFPSSAFYGLITMMGTWEKSRGSRKPSTLTCYFNKDGKEKSLKGHKRPVLCPVCEYLNE